MNINFATNNKTKYKIALKSLENTGVSITQMSVLLPELQSDKVEEIAKYSASWASIKLQLPIVVSDTGFYIEALNGFPGPLVKHINNWLSVEDYINLIKNKKNRLVYIRDCLAYCEPHKEPVIFLNTFECHITNTPGRPSKNPIEQIVVPNGFSVPISEIPRSEIIKHWSNSGSWKMLVDYLSKLKVTEKVVNYGKQE